MDLVRYADTAGDNADYPIPEIHLYRNYIIDSFMVVVFGGVGNLWGTLVSAMSLGLINNFLEPWAGAMLAKVLVLIMLILFIQKKPKGLFPQKGRAAAD